MGLDARVELMKDAGLYPLRRGTWLSFGNKGPLVIAVEGDPKLIIATTLSS